MIVVVMGVKLLDTLTRITQLREMRGWSEYQLAEASEIAQSTISSWYRKNMLPSISSLEKICRGFGITMAYFFSESSEAITLTKEERTLLDHCSKLTPEGRRTLIDFLEQI